MTEESEKILKRLREKREAILVAAAKHGAKNVRIFGSVARGEAGPGSDIDLLVEMEPERSYFELVELGREVEEAVGRKADVLEEPELNPYVRKRIMAEAVPL